MYDSVKSIIIHIHTYIHTQKIHTNNCSYTKIADELKKELLYVKNTFLILESIR